MGMQKNSKFSFGDDPRAFTFLTEDYETIEDFISSLNIPYEGEFDGDTYRLDLPDSDTYSEVFNIISLNNELTADEGSIANDAEARFRFFNSNYEIRLEADFMDDVYKFTVERR